jgi:alpha-L-fucosidase
VVAKGGSLLLGIGPKPDGTLPEDAVNKLGEIGKWMNKNGNAIYNTRTTNIYKSDSTFFTKSKNGELHYALVCLNENEVLPEFVTWSGNIPVKGSTIHLLQTNEKVNWKKEGERVKVYLPASLIKSKTAIPALAFKFIKE